MRSWGKFQGLGGLRVSYGDYPSKPYITGGGLSRVYRPLGRDLGSISGSPGSGMFSHSPYPPQFLPIYPTNSLIYPAKLPPHPENSSPGLSQRFVYFPFFLADFRIFVGVEAEHSNHPPYTYIFIYIFRIHIYLYAIYIFPDPENV